MTSPLLALLVQTLREDCRKPLTYSLRAGVIAACALYLLFTIGLRGWQGAPGLDLLWTIALIQCLAITGAGILLFASAIAEERQEGSLDLLRLTDLGSVAILIGKAAGHFAGTLLMLLALSPLMLLGVSLGGVSAAQIFGAELFLISYAFFVANLALLCSVLASRTGPAVALTAAALTLLGAVLLLAPAVAAAMNPSGLAAAAGWLAHAAPWTELSRIFRTSEPAPVAGWPSCCNLGTGVLCFLVAALVFSRKLDAEETGEPLGNPVRPRPHLPRDRVWRDVIAWRDFHFVHGGAFARRAKLIGALASFIALGAATWFWGLARDEIVRCAVWAAGVFSLAWVIDLALAGARAFRDEIDGRTLTALAVTPIEPGYLVRCKLVCAATSTWPLGAALVLALTSLVAATLLHRRGGLNVPAALAQSSIALALIGAYLLPQAQVLVSTAAWLSLRLRYGAPLLAIALVAIMLAVFAAVAHYSLFIGFVGLPGTAIFLALELSRSLSDRLDELIEAE